MKKLTLITFLKLICLANILAQTATSGKVIIHINNKTTIEEIKPQGKIIAPDISVFGNYYALIIGISNYSDPEIEKTDRSVEDADLFYDLITSRYSFENANVRIIKNATLSEIMDGLEYFAKKVESNDNFLLFYTGQGYWDDALKSGFWLPSDAKSLGFWFPPSDENENKSLAWFSSDMLGDYLSKINSKHTLLIADASFGGSLFNINSTTGGTADDINKLNELKGRKAMISGINLKESFRGEFLKRLISEMQRNSDKYVNSEKLFSNLVRQLSNSTTTTPQFGVIDNLGDEGGDFIFIRRE